MLGKSEGETLMNTLRFFVPGEAAEAVNVRQLETRGRKAGVTVVQLAYQFAARESGDGDGYRCRIICSAQMAVFLIEQLRVAGSDAMDRGDTLLAAACVRASRETFTSLMEPDSRRSAARARDGRAKAIVSRL
jgi:hypothetical protein